MWEIPGGEKAACLLYYVLLLALRFVPDCELRRSFSLRVHLSLGCVGGGETEDAPLGDDPSALDGKYWGNSTLTFKYSASIGPKRWGEFDVCVVTECSLSILEFFPIIPSTTFLNRLIEEVERIAKGTSPVHLSYDNVGMLALIGGRIVAKGSSLEIQLSNTLGHW